MSISEKKQALSQGEVNGKPEKIPSPKEEKQDTSPFKGRPYFPTKEFNRWLKSPEAWKKTGLLEKERLKLGPKISERKMVGEFFKKGEPKKIKEELEKGRWGKFRNLSPEERKRVMKLYEGFFGK